MSIDDFGTGNASIAYLTKLPASEIKIDKSFITDICEDKRAEAIVRSTIDLARHLDLHVVAEGVVRRPFLTASLTSAQNHTELTASHPAQPHHGLAAD